MASPATQISPKRLWLKRGLLGALAVAMASFALRNVILGTPLETYEALRGVMVAGGRSVYGFGADIGILCLVLAALLAIAAKLYPRLAR